MPPSSEVRHRPVMPDEVLRLLDPRPGETWVDCTVGGGGHARLIAEKIGPGGRLIGLDQDPTMLEAGPAGTWRACRSRWFMRTSTSCRKCSRTSALNRWMASWPIWDSRPTRWRMPARGLSFRAEGPLDMRLDPTAGTTAAELVNTMSEAGLADLFYEYGEERQSRRVARKIVERRKSRPFATTSDLADVVRSCVRKSGSIDPATRVFQALRIAVNDELGALDRLLAALPRVVKPGGRAGIISFHSLEDRRVKHAFRTREVVGAGDEEAGRGRAMRKSPRNPRARSAKLRVARRTNRVGSTRPSREVTDDRSHADRRFREGHFERQAGRAEPRGPDRRGEAARQARGRSAARPRQQDLPRLGRRQLLPASNLTIAAAAVCSLAAGIAAVRLIWPESEQPTAATAITRLRTRQNSVPERR